MCKVVLKQTTVTRNRVDFSYLYPDAWNVFVCDPSERLFAEYDFDLAEVPKSILNILFVSNMLVLAMFEDGNIYVDELDRDFYEAIPNILDGYRWLYPDRKIDCHVHCQQLVDNRYTPSETRLLAFTGGVDATSALASHAEEKLVLVNIWGGDIRFDNEVRYQSHARYFRQLAQNMGNGFALVKSNFRFLYNDSKIPVQFDQDWWAAVGHSLLIIATFAPIAYRFKAEKIYMGSGYTTKEYLERRPASCNYSGIVNAVRIASCAAVQCDGDLTRTEKINNITQKLNLEKTGKIQILACWRHLKDSTVNCSGCEKCARTIMNIIACKADPNMFGFNVTDRTYTHIRVLIGGSRDLPEEMWREIQQAFQADKPYWKKNKRVNWIFKLKINQPNRNFFYISMKLYWGLRRICGLIKRKLMNIGK